MSDYEKKIEEMEQEEMELDDEVLELVGDDGEVANFYHLATLEYKNEWYVVLQPAEATEEISEDELVIMKLSTDANDDDVFLPIEDDDTLNAVYDEYVKIAEQNGDIIEDETEEDKEEIKE
ncbi:MAG: DUF1292 domain-containing protein [Clostridia bacterium]